MRWIVDGVLDGWVPMSMGDDPKNEGDLSDHLKRSGICRPAVIGFLTHPPSNHQNKKEEIWHIFNKYKCMMWQSIKDRK
jgi:hypothetical protein